MENLRELIERTDKEISILESTPLSDKTKQQLMTALRMQCALVFEEVIYKAIQEKHTSDRYEMYADAILDRTHKGIVQVVEAKIATKKPRGLMAKRDANAFASKIFDYLCNEDAVFNVARNTGKYIPRRQIAQALGLTIDDIQLGANVLLKDGIIVSRRAYGYCIVDGGGSNG